MWVNAFCCCYNATGHEKVIIYLFKSTMYFLLAKVYLVKQTRVEKTIYVISLGVSINDAKDIVGGLWFYDDNIQTIKNDIV